MPGFLDWKPQRNTDLRPKKKRISLVPESSSHGAGKVEPHGREIPVGDEIPLAGTWFPKGKAGPGIKRLQCFGIFQAERRELNWERRTA
jgi:hypothetical protein